MESIAPELLAYYQYVINQATVAVTARDNFLHYLSKTYGLKVGDQVGVDGVIRRSVQEPTAHHVVDRPIDLGLS